MHGTRRTRPGGPAPAAVSLCLAAATALAPAWAAAARLEAGDDLSRLPTYAMELAAGPYHPVLSRDADAARARAVIFDEEASWLSRHPISVSGLFSRYLLDGFGLLGPYVRVAFWRQSAPARACRDPSDPNAFVPCTLENIDTSEKSADRTSLNVLPVGVGAMWRVDVLRRTHSWPVALAVRAGVDYHIFWSTLGDSLERLPSSGAKAAGGVWGLGGAVQVALGLDGLRRRPHAYGSRRADNPTYLFAEYRLSWAPGLLQRGTRLDFSDFSSFALGLALEVP